ncbi:hypothetical protein CLV36_11752 [Laceyella sediminis]|uniref:Uncharacterized protein n=1 Tax=Laceyella sediminis TaxID=573074 RepID=A0ABX5ENP7_9BACL|nr:hypothetical protein [Laceyella sediminis]PRZ12073.1 hypothetical protein CLV36_11752 [Laceyella sediminis]
MSLQLVENKQMNGSSNGIDTSKMYKLVPGNNGQRPLTFERMSGWEQAVLLNYASDPLGGRRSGFIGLMIPDIASKR